MSKSALKNKPASQLTVIPIHPVTWDVVEVNKKVEGLGGNWDNINPYDIYQESTFLMLTNRVLQARWQYDVVSKVTYQGEDGETYCTTCSCEYKLNEPTLFKEGADILMDELKGLLKVELLNLNPESIVITASGFVTVGKRNAHARNNRPKTGRKR